MAEAERAKQEEAKVASQAKAASEAKPSPPRRIDLLGRVAFGVYIAIFQWKLLQTLRMTSAGQVARGR